MIYYFEQIGSLQFQLQYLFVIPIRILVQIIINKEMRIISMHVLKWEEEKSLFICSAYELGFARFKISY